MTKTFKEIIDGIRTAILGIEVREDIAQGMEYVEQFADTSTTKAQEAAESAAAAERAKTDTLAAKTEAVQAISTEKQAGLDAISTAKSNAVKETQSAHTAALQDISNARAGALNDVAASTKMATNAASKSTQKAGEASTSAADAQQAKTNAEAAATAAGESQAAAKTAQKKAEAAAALAGTRAGTDKTLAVEDAPADAKAVGNALKKISINTMTGATASAAGKAGLVPAPAAGAQGKFLRGDGTWATPEKTTYSVATQSAAGLMSAADKKRLDNLYPVGSIYQSTNSTSPAALFGGTWEQIASDRVLMGASSSHAAGTTVAAGLPNITGSTGRFVVTCLDKAYDPDRANGALSYSGLDEHGGFYSSSGSYGRRYYIDFNASKSNAIYGRSSTVQPAAYYVHIWRRVA